MEEKKENKKFEFDDLLDEILYALRTIVTTSVVVFMVFNFVFTPVTVDGPSMSPTLESHQWGFSSLFNRYIGSYNRFDVVVVYYEEKDMQLVKRIVGLPGEKIEYKDDKLYVNDKYVEEKFFDQDFVDRQTYDGSIKFTEDCGPYYLGEDEYFVIGDNRPRSTDSRVLGTFSREDISSKSILVLWPLDSIHYAGKQ